MRRATLITYNLRVVLFNNWWLLVFPIAVSQLSVFWYIVTQKFSPGLPTTSAEMITPLLAAFLAVHILSAEYQSRVGAILASKPVHIGKVVLARLGAVFALVWLLELLSLSAFYFGMEPYDLGGAFLASIPSTVFLALLALTFATLLRHPLAGFGIAALYWALNLPPGPPMNAYFGLHSYASYVGAPKLSFNLNITPWWVSKILLLVAAVLLYALHRRLVFQLGVPPTMRARRRTVGWAAAFLCVYLILGATAKVAYGYAHRGSLDPNDGGWFRLQFGSFGPIPVSYLFGPAFHRYLGPVQSAWRLQQEDEADMLGNTAQHRRELREVLDRMPHSMWAASAADLLVRMVGREEGPVEDRAALFQRVVDSYPGSPYVDYALHEKAMVYDGANLHQQAADAYAELLRRRPNSAFRSEALHYLVDYARERHDLRAAEKWAADWQASAPIQDRFTAWAELAEIRNGLGDSAGAKEAARQTFATAAAYREAHNAGRINARAGQLMKWEAMSRDAERMARRFMR